MLRQNATYPLEHAFNTFEKKEKKTKKQRNKEITDETRPDAQIPLLVSLLLPFRVPRIYYIYDVAPDKACIPTTLPPYHPTCQATPPAHVR